MDSARGGRRHGGLIDEVRDHDSEELNSVVIPLMNVSRRMLNGELNPHEPHQQQMYMSSASVKGSYAYERLIELLELSIIRPKDAFVFGVDYRVPMMHGLLDEAFINEQRMSNTFKEDAFAREFLGSFTGGSSEAWFDFEKLSKYRVLVNPETAQKSKDDKNIFYLLSVDVARKNMQTIVSVWKVFIKSGGFYSNLVNMFVLGKTEKEKHFSIQASDLKQLIQKYQPREVVIDGAGSTGPLF